MTAPSMTIRDIALWIWERAINQPYRWGGNDPMTGFDCSGLVLEGLKGCGLYPRDADDTAAGLAKKFPEATTMRPGVLLFWGAPTITHVEIVWRVIGSQVFTIGASGGGSDTVSADVAIRRDAYTKVRPARPGWVKAVDPFWQ